MEYPVADLTRKHIAQLLDRLIVDYQNAKEDRVRLAENTTTELDEFSVLEEIELFTVDIRGYGSQIKSYGKIEHEEKAAMELSKMRLLEVNSVAKWYFESSSEDYWHLKLYVRMLDYLRLLILEDIKSRCAI
jgi:hypothetical protein